MEELPKHSDLTSEAAFARVCGAGKEPCSLVVRGNLGISGDMPKSPLCLGTTPAMSFTHLLAHLATIVRNTMRPKSARPGEATFALTEADVGNL